jgi:hypothetical protein
MNSKITGAPVNIFSLVLRYIIIHKNDDLSRRRGLYFRLCGENVKKEGKRVRSLEQKIKEKKALLP